MTVIRIEVSLSQINTVQITNIICSAMTNMDNIYFQIKFKIRNIY